MIPEQYITEHSLWDLAKLKVHAQANFVYVIESPRFPGLVMLHYQDSVQWEKNWNTFNRFSRGLILDMKNKKVLSHGFDKFNNLGEVPETSYDSLLSLGGFQTSEKLDGSCILTFLDPNTNKLTFTTKGSFDSEHGVYANQLSMPEGFWKVAESYNRMGTLIFELVAKQFQIVIDYSKKSGYEQGLYLIGFRNHTSNTLSSYEGVQSIAKELGVPTFKTYSFGSLDQLIDTAKALPVLEEGYVLRFPGDLLVKVKGNAYLEMHRFISHLSDRNILEAVANNTADKLAELCPEEYRDDVVNKIAYFQKRVAELEKECYTLFERAPKDVQRKAYAFWVQRNVPSHLKGFIFQLLDGKQVDRKQMFKVLEEIDRVDGKTRI